MTAENQDFEIIAIDHPDYIERIDAIDKITDFKTLEESFITDEYITVRMKAFDRLTELYHNTNRYRRMIKNWKDVSDFLGWIHFTIDELRQNNNIEKTIRFILERRGYPFEGFWNRWYASKRKNQIFQKVVDVSLLPIIYYNHYNPSKKEIETRWTKYGPQYHYEMVIKILVENNNHELSHDYVFIRAWNSHENVHEQFYKKLNYEVKK